MENLGAYLQKIREEKGISSKKVFADICLREEQLRQIEEDRLSELGTFGIAQAIVRKYALYLQADVPAVMKEMALLIPEHDKREFKPKQPVRNKKILLSPNFFWLIGIILFIVALATIVWHAHQQGWLKTPEIFKKAVPDSTLVQKAETEPVQPDSLRDRMRQLSTRGAANPGRNSADTDAQTRALSDSTDYLGRILGPSKVNVPLH